MSNSWKPQYNSSSPGFVYFKNNEQSSPVTSKESSDFISFGDSQGTPSKNQFSPRNYSSPRQQWNSPNQHWGSPGNRGNHGNKFRQNRFSNHNTSFSPNKTYNSSFNRRSGSFNKSKNADKTFSKERYLHPSFLENPWAQLEEELKEDHDCEDLAQANVDN